jgi:hypothetical protein
MQVRKIVVLAAVLIGFAGAPVSRAFADDSSPTTSTTKHKKKKKKSKKAKAKKHARAKKSAAHHAHAKKNAGGAAAGTHYPTQPGGTGFADIPAEKKDDLPPPSAPANQ